MCPDATNEPAAYGARRPLFRKIRNQRAFEDVAAQIQQAIASGHYVPGDRLPPERELTELFQVSRGSLREGLRVLEKAGVLMIKPGAAGGAFVRELSLDPVTDSLGLALQLGALDIAELADFRALLEGGAAYRAALRANDADLARLEAAVAGFRALMADDTTTPEQFVAQDLQFHLAVLESARNGLILAVNHAIRGAMAASLRFIPAGQQGRMLVDMTALLDAIQQSRPTEAQRIMEAHIVHFNELILANIAADHPG